MLFLYILMCDKMTLQETTRSQIHYFVKKLIITDKYHLLWIYSYILVFLI